MGRYNKIKRSVSVEGKIYQRYLNNSGGYAAEGSIKKLQVNMANIRKKLGDKPGETNFIANELGVGYRLNER